MPGVWSTPFLKHIEPKFQLFLREIQDPINLFIHLIVNGICMFPALGKKQWIQEAKCLPSETLQSNAGRQQIDKFETQYNSGRDKRNLFNGIFF